MVLAVHPLSHRQARIAAAQMISTLFISGAFCPMSLMTCRRAVTHWHPLSLLLAANTGPAARLTLTLTRQTMHHHSRCCYILLALETPKSCCPIPTTTSEKLNKVRTLPLPPTVLALQPPQSGTHYPLASAVLLLQTLSVASPKLTASSRPTAPTSSSAKCLRFGHWMTLCNPNILLTYILIYLQQHPSKEETLKHVSR